MSLSKWTKFSTSGIQHGVVSVVVARVTVNDAARVRFPASPQINQGRVINSKHTMVYTSQSKKSVYFLAKSMKSTHFALRLTLILSG